MQKEGLIQKLGPSLEEQIPKMDINGELVMNDNASALSDCGSYIDAKVPLKKDKGSKAYKKAEGDGDDYILPTEQSLEMLN